MGIDKALNISYNKNVKKQTTFIGGINYGRKKFS